MVFEYSWSDYSFSVSPEIVGKKFEEIERTDGAVTAEKFLDVSRPEDSETHSLFEWDDEVAAERYRLHQSRCVINSLRVTVYGDDESEEPKQTRAYVNVGKERKGAEYISFVTAISQEETRELIYQRALKEIESFERKYREMEEFEGVIREMDKILLSA